MLSGSREQNSLISSFSQFELHGIKINFIETKNAFVFYFQPLCSHSLF
jgi:hypothetical protein